MHVLMLFGGSSVEEDKWPVCVQIMELISWEQRKLRGAVIIKSQTGTGSSVTAWHSVSL